MLKFNCFITGDDFQILKSDTPESRKKVAALSSVIFIPVIIWVANGFLLVTHVLKGTIFSASIVALILGVIIFLIEKNIIMAHTTRSIKIFRYSLGIIIALLGAVCLDEVVFKQDVDQQLFAMNKQYREKKIAEFEDSKKADLEKAQMDVDKKYAAWQHSSDEASKEADGTGGSGSKGVKEIAKLKLALAEADKAELDMSTAVLKELKEKQEAEKTELEAQIKASQDENALLYRIKALFHLVFSDWYMGIIYTLFTLFLFAMEFLVVFLKNAWPQTNYERRLELIEEIGKRRMAKVLQGDLNHFESGRVYPAHARALKAIKSGNSSSMFN